MKGQWHKILGKVSLLSNKDQKAKDDPTELEEEQDEDFSEEELEKEQSYVESELPQKKRRKTK